MEQAFATLDDRLVANQPSQLGLELVDYLDQNTGLLCRLVQDEEGRYTGYVALPRGHPFYGLPLDGCPVECREVGSGPCEHSPVTRLRGMGEILQAAPEGHRWWISFTLPATLDQASAALAHMAQRLALLGPLDLLSLPPEMG